MPKQVLETDIEKATSEFNVTEDWQVFMDICDRIKTMPNGPKDGLKFIMKRVNNQIPHVALQALTLLSTCISNCGKAFLLEVSSRDWCNNAKTVITRGHEKVSQRLREMIKKWAEDDFKDDPQLALMVQFYKRLKQDGFTFDFSSDKTSSSLVASLVQTPKTRSEDDSSFQDDLQLALAMSLQDAESNNGQKSSSTGGSSLYPSFNSSSTTNSSAQPLYQEETELFKVRALYDFEAAEDNEMTFKIGDIFTVLDNSDENWWKGKNEAGIGLFPATFVTTDLTVPASEKSEKKVRFADSNDDESSQQQQQYQDIPTQQIVQKKIVINEEHLDLTLSMLKNASPHGLDDQEDSIVNMEDGAKEMGTLVEKKILECERRKDDLGDLNDKFLQALQMYQQLMKEPMNAPLPPHQPVAAAGLPPQQPMYGHRSPQHSLQYQAPPQPHSLPHDPNYQYPAYSTPAYSSLPTVPPQYQPADPRLYQQQQQSIQQPTTSYPQPPQQQHQPIIAGQAPQQVNSIQQQYSNTTEQYYTSAHAQYGNPQHAYSMNSPQNASMYQQTSVYQ